MSTEAKIISINSGAGDNEFVKGLGLTSATTLVMGSMIGSGIFIVSADIARLVDSPALLIAAWLVTGFMTITGALAYGELAAMMPHAGGQYVYLRESLGPLWGFLYGWTLFLVIQTGTIAAVGVACGKFLGVFFPSISSSHWILHLWKVPPIPIGPMVLGNMDVGLNTQNLVAVLVVVFLSVLNIFGVRTGRGGAERLYLRQDRGAAGTGAAGLVRRAQRAGASPRTSVRTSGATPGWSALHPVQVGIGGPIALVGTLTILAVAQVGSLFSADAWNNVTFTAGEVRNPQRNLPLSLALGTGAVILLYVLANVVYLNVLPLQGDANGATHAGARHSARLGRPGRDGGDAADLRLRRRGDHGGGDPDLRFRLRQRADPGGRARLLRDGARTGCSSAAQRELHPKYRTPAHSLVMQCIWTCVLCISGSYGQLLDYIIFAVLMFYILTIAGLVRVCAVKRPDEPRPYRAIGYPVLPAVYILMAVFIDVVLLRYKPQYTWPGLIIVLLGIPVYFLWSRRNRTKRLQGLISKERQS